MKREHVQQIIAFIVVEIVVIATGICVWRDIATLDHVERILAALAFLTLPVASIIVMMIPEEAEGGKNKSALDFLLEAYNKR